jgi:hypothetical protein
MTRPRTIASALIAAAIGTHLLSPGPLGMSLAHAQSEQKAPQETARPEIAKPLQEAQQLAQGGKVKEALAKLAETDAVPNKTPYESFMIDRMRGPIAAAAGEDKTAIKSLEVLVASERVPVADKLAFMPYLATLYFRQKDYPNAVTWSTRYLNEGGNDPKIRTLQIQSYYLSNDFTHAAQELRADIEAGEKAGKAPTEDQLKLLASAVQKQNDKAGYVEVLEKYITYYPKKEYWADLLGRVFAKPGFSERLQLDGYRLKQATGLFGAARDYTDMAELAMRAGFPAEAKNTLDQGFQSGVLGSGADAARHKRLRDAAAKAMADDEKTMAQGEADAKKSKDGTGLVNLGYAYVTAGQADKGIGMMEQGIRNGGIKYPEEAKLHLAVAYAKTGKKAEALQTLKTIKGSDGVADLAHYWTLHLKQSA